MKSKSLEDALNCKECEIVGNLSYQAFQKTRENVPVKISVKHLPENISESGVKNLFLNSGVPLSIEFYPNRQSAIVEFKTWNEADLAIRDLNNTPPYNLKVSVLTPKNNTSNTKYSNVNEDDDSNNFCPIYVSSETHDTKVSLTAVTTEEISDQKEIDEEVKTILESLNYDPSIRMRQRKLDFKRKWNCVSLGRGYYYGEKRQEQVGGLEIFSMQSKNGRSKFKLGYLCENCDFITTTVCTECSVPYCSEKCLNNRTSHHYFGCKEKLNLASSNDSQSSLQVTEDDVGAVEDSGDESFVDSAFELKSGCTVVLSTYCTTQVVYVRVAESESETYFSKLCNDVAFAAMEDKGLRVTPKVGEVYAAEYYEDHRYYRARINSIIDEGNVRVTFIDYGNIQNTKVKDLKPIPDRFKKIKDLAVKVQLKGVFKGSTLDSVNYLNVLTAERIPLTLKFDNLSEGVTLIDAAANQVVNCTVGKLSQPSWREDKSILSKTGEVLLMESLNLKNLKVGASYDLCVSHMDEKEFLDSGAFWMVQKDSDDYLHAKSEMKKRIWEYCEILKNDCYLPRVNELCLAKENGDWHRCVNLKNHKTTSFLFFVDKGHSSVVPTSNIRKIIRDFIEISAQAIFCVFSDELPVKTNQELKNKVAKFLKSSLAKTVKSVRIDKFLGDSYCIFIPELKELC